MGELTERKRGTTKYEHICSLYADDAALFFDSMGDLRRGASCLYEHLLALGLTMRSSTGAAPSKTEAMYFSPPRRLYSEADTSRLGVFDYWGILLASSILRRNSNTLIRQSPIILLPQMHTLKSAFGRHRPPLGLLYHSDYPIKWSQSQRKSPCSALLEHFT
jgi:hypothetical protein